MRWCFVLLNSLSLLLSKLDNRDVGQPGYLMSSCRTWFNYSLVTACCVCTWILTAFLTQILQLFDLLRYNVHKHHLAGSSVVVTLESRMIMVYFVSSLRCFLSHAPFVCFASGEMFSCWGDQSDAILQVGLQKYLINAILCSCLLCSDLPLFLQLADMPQNGQAQQLTYFTSWTRVNIHPNLAKNTISVTF